MARAGMTGPMTVFEGRYGLFQSYGIPDESDFSRLTADLGARWEIARISIKPYPCCHFAHAFVDCARALRRQGVRAEDVEQLQCIVPEIELPLICEPWDAKLRPDSPYAAKFSLPFLVAAALIDDAVNHDTFAANNLARRELLELASRVTYRTAAAGELPFPKYFPGWIQGILRGGRRIEQRLEVNYGNPDNPMSRADIETKFCSNAAGIVPQESIAGVLSTVAALENSTARNLTRFLASRNQESS
jgi:2-methylcitrate dehydratase PrpD